MRKVKGIADTPCEGKTFDITFRWARHFAPGQAKSNT
jgi:hypothetical protein